jgi:spermidine synthase
LATKVTSSLTARSKDISNDKSSAVEEKPMGNVFGVALALSGMAAIVYQVLWVRQLGLVVGVEVYSITVAVSAFFAGLALGGAVFGRLADKLHSPARLYAALEVAIALCAIATTLLLPRAAMPFVWMTEHAGALAWLIPFVLVALPAFAMGGTLPVAVRAVRASGRGAARVGGLLYAANTAGGILGALAASFVMIPVFGVLGAAVAAAMLNVAAGVMVLVAFRHEADSDVRDVKDVEDASISRLALTLYAIAGGVALGYEVVWTQAIGQFVSTRAFAFSIVLAVYLTGLAVGGWVGARLAGRVRESWGVFGILIAGAGLAAMVEFAVMGPWVVKAQYAVGNAALAVTGSLAAKMYASFAAAGVGMVLVPTLLLGAAFPMALRLMVGVREVGREVGAVVAANTAGGVLGTLVVGFWMIPALGLVRTLALLTIGAAAVGLIAALMGSQVQRGMRWVVGAVAVGIVGASLVTPANKLAELLLAPRGGGTLVFYEEGRGATVAVAQQRSKDNVFRRLFIQGVSNSGDAMPSMRYMRLQAMLPLMIHGGEPRRVMIVGFGTGITAGETLRYPGLEQRVCAELLPAVVRSGEMFPENYRAWSDPQMAIRLRDGRQELMRSAERYDVITLEAPPPSAQGVANLYSTEFYELAKKRLAAKGLFAQWLPIATQNERETRELVRSFLDVFPYATLWTTELHEMLLIGSEAPIRLDAQAMEKRFASAPVVASLKGVGVESTAALLAMWITGREGLEEFAADAKPVTDDRPRIEYGPWVRPDEITRVLPELLALQTKVPVEGANEALSAEVETKRKTLMDFYTAGLAAYGGDRETWARTITGVQAAEPANAYYSWIIGRD